MGFTHDAFDPDVLLEEFRKQAQDNDEENVEKDSNPERAKQYLIFMISNWSPDHCKLKHTIARYATGNGISSQFLLSEINNMIISLSRVGLIVNNVVADGATENRSAMRALATHTVKEVLGKNDFFTEDQNKYLDMEKKIAFLHPKRSDVLIFIGGDMPHIVKRIVNVLESSSKENSKRNLEHNGDKLNLKMLRDVWECDSGKMGNLRTNMLTNDHFVKNSYSRMRVHLAVQVVSNSMVRLINDYAKICGGEKNMSHLS